jgi:nicotinate-nucleotide adenylyltransferase
MVLSNFGKAILFLNHMKIGLFFGSFNPVHTGHLILANYLVEESDLDELWLVISPHNPFKERSTLADDYVRYEMVLRSVEDHPKLKACNVEFDLPKPSYTIDTLKYLSEEHPEHEFVLIMGGDNLASLNKWKNYEQILLNYSIYVYKRPEYQLGELASHSRIKIFENAPLIEISSTFIRKLIKEGKSIRYWVTEETREIIESTALYRP